jgi:transposase
LYAVEELCPKDPEGDAMRLELRKERSASIVEQLKSFAMTTPVVPESGLDKAIKYMAGLWSGLVRFLDDPRIPLDNNATERAERGVVVGRKNHYGSRSKRGTEVAALFYSLVESAKLCGLDPKAYLRKAVTAALGGERIPLPHEVAAAL